MHTLLVLSVALAAFPGVELTGSSGDSIALDALIPAHPSLRLSAHQPASPRQGLHFAEPVGTRQTGDEVVGRILLETLLGVGLGVGGTVAGALLVSNSDAGVQSLIPLSLLLVGSGMGVHVAGSLMGGGGTLGSALLGSLAGFAAWFGSGALLLTSRDCVSRSVENCSAFKPYALSLLLFPTVGAIIGYEISTPASAGTERSPRPRVVPMLAPARQGLGGTLGVAGTL